MTDPKNVLGQPLQPCSIDPLTGFYRDGTCRSGKDDVGCHSVCVTMTEDFLRFSMLSGNDLSTPRPEYDFPGLLPGNRWCLCALRWKEAYDAGNAPLVDLEATHESALQHVALHELLECAIEAE